LIAFIVVILGSLIMIIFLYEKRNEQKEQIEAQNKNIAMKSEQLEKRNQHLMALDEEKNTLIKIVAHDLRTPIHQVQGLAQIIPRQKKEPAVKQVLFQGKFFRLFQ